MARAAIERPSGRSVFTVDRMTIGLHAASVAVDLDDHLDRLRFGLHLPDAALIEVIGPILGDRRALLEDDPYEEWAMAARDDLEADRARARVAYARALDRTHAPVAARSHAWRSVVDSDPADEDAWLALVRAEREAGRPDRALRASFHARVALRDSLDAEAGPELGALHRELLGRSPAWAPPGPVGGARRMFGREPLQAKLDRLLTDLDAGAGRDMILVAPAGMGKTRLLDDAVQRARSRTVLVGRGTSVPEDRRVPYTSLRQALRGLPIDLIPLKPRLARLLDRDLATVARPGPDQARDLALLAEEVVDAIEQMAVDRPVLLVLDDIQWVDPALRVVLQRLAATPGRRRWGLLTAARTDERDAWVPSGLGEIVSVPPLPDAAIAELVRDTLDGTGDASTVRDAVERSAGNPLFAQELARAGPASGDASGSLPERIVEVIGRRFDQRGPVARRILPVLALGDETVRNDVLLVVLGDDASALDGIDELIGASLIQRVDEGLRIAHPLIRMAAADRLNPIRRARLHARFADAIEGLGMHRAELVLGAVRHRIAAWEWGRLAEDAGPAASAAWRGARIVDEEFSIDATSDLLHAGLAAYAAAPDLARRELALEAAIAQVRLGEIQLDSGHESAARTCFERALTIDGSDEVQALGWSALGGLPYRRGDMVGAAAAYRAGLAALTNSGGVSAAGLRSDLGWALWRAGEPGALELVSDSAIILAEHGGPAIASRALDRLAMMTTDRDAALEASDHAFAQLRRGSDRREFGTLLVHRASIERQADRLPGALRSVDEAVQLFQAAGDRYMQAVCLWTRADVLEAMDDYEAALAARDAEAILLIAIDNPRNLVGCQVHRARLLGRLGRSAEAAQAFAAARIAAEQAADPALVAMVSASEGSPT